MNTKNLEQSWRKELGNEFQKPYMLELVQFINTQKAQGAEIFPPEPLVFNAFNHCAFADVKVVIIGQDPYHGPGQAHGLSFSVPRGMKLPPSLRNIYKEIASDLGQQAAANGLASAEGDLTRWASQGVLLLNATLTVEAKKPGSHQGQGWEEFTDKVVEVLNGKKENLVFILWGAYAQKKGANINQEKHLVIESAHPSPFSAHRGFFGSRPFSKANEFLKEKGVQAIGW